MSTPIIRAATQNDAQPIALLIGQLGYPIAPDDVRTQLRRIEDFATATVLVAEEGGEVVGLTSVHMFPALHVPTPAAQLTVLVVDADHAHKGIGRALCAAAEHWAHERGAARLSVLSGTHRIDAHEFYARMGYRETGVRLTKAL